MEVRNSGEVALKLVDKARKLGVPVKLEVSLVAHSDSRYVILFPGEPCEEVIRISSHRPYEPKYALSLRVQRPELLQSAVALGRAYLDKNYGTYDQIQAARTRGRSAVTDVHHGRRGGDGPVRSRAVQAVSRPDRDDRDWVRRRSTKRVRITGPKPKWIGGKTRRVRDEWDRDD